MAFLYTDNELSERETKKKMPFTIATRKIKYLGINLTKDVKTCTQKTIEHWRKEMKKTQINGSIYCVHGLEELTSSKYPYYPKKCIDSM